MLAFILYVLGGVVLWDSLTDTNCNDFLPKFITVLIWPLPALASLGMKIWETINGKNCI